MPFDERELTGEWDYSSLPSNIEIGSDCWLEARHSFDRCRSEHQPGLRLGARSRVWMWSSFSIEPTGVVEVGNDASFVGAVFMCAKKISVGERVSISYQVTLSDADFHPFDPEQRKADAMAIRPAGDRSQRPPYHAAPITIGNEVVIGIGAMVLKGVTIGDGARVEAGAIVTRDVPAGAIVAGNPARIISA